MSDKSVEQMEQYARERWDKAYEFQSLSGHSAVQFGSHSLGNWSDAYAFTLRREQEIREKREEIALMEYLLYAVGAFIPRPVHQRIVSILESQLADLLKGFKEVAHVR